MKIGDRVGFKVSGKCRYGQIGIAIFGDRATGRRERTHGEPCDGADTLIVSTWMVSGSHGQRSHWKAYERLPSEVTVCEGGPHV